MNAQHRPVFGVYLVDDKIDATKLSSLVVNGIKNAVEEHFSDYLSDDGSSDIDVKTIDENIVRVALSSPGGSPLVGYVRFDRID